MLALAARAGIAALPLAMTTIWLANTASLLLPVSNLTNLLAADRIGAGRAGVRRADVGAAARLDRGRRWLFLWVFYWRRGRRGADRYTPPAPVRRSPTRSVPCSGSPARPACCSSRRSCASACRSASPPRRRALSSLVVAFAVRDRAALRLEPDPVAAAGLRHRPVPGRADAQPATAWPTLMTRAHRHRPRRAGAYRRGRRGRGAVQRAQQPARVRGGRGGGPAGRPATSCSRC